MQILDLRKVPLFCDLETGRAGLCYQRCTGTKFARHATSRTGENIEASDGKTPKPKSCLDSKVGQAAVGSLLGQHSASGGELVNVHNQTPS